MSSRSSAALPDFAPDDADAVRDILTASEEYAIASSGNLPEGGDLQSLFYALPESADPEVKRLMVLTVDSCAVGVADVLEGWPLPDTITVGLFLIHPRHQRARVAARALDIAIDLARAGGFHRIRAACARGWEPGEQFLAHDGFVRSAAGTVRLNRVIHEHEGEHPVDVWTLELRHA